MSEKLNQMDLKQIRGVLKLSQEQMANELGITREHYGKLENDSEKFRGCKIETLLKLQKLSNLTSDKINFFY